MFPWFNHRDDDKCLHVALPVAAFIEMLSKSVASRATTAYHAGCVQRGLGKNMPFSRWPKTQHTPAEHRGAQWKQDHRYWEASYKNKAFVIVLQETLCTTADKLVIPNFSLAGSTLSRNHGLATFVHERLEWSMVDQSPEQSETEWLCIDLAGHKIINVYKPLRSRFTPTAIPTFPHPSLLATSTANMSTGVTTKHLLTVRAWIPGQHPPTLDCYMTQRKQTVSPFTDGTSAPTQTWTSRVLARTADCRTDVF